MSTKKPVKKSVKRLATKRKPTTYFFFSRFSRKHLILIAFVLLFGAVGSYLLIFSNAEFVVPNKDKAIEDANWMMGASIPDATPLAGGALATYIDKQHIRPYQANLGALGLARATQISGDKKYVDVVWRHLNWYANHMDAKNFVHDYDFDGTKWVIAPNYVVDPTKLSDPYDSVDSYAATFLLATRAAYRADSDMTKLEALRPAINKAVAAIRSMQQADGLTWAADFWDVKLLEDNVETYQGLKAATTLANLLGDTTLAVNTQSYAASMATGIESLWSQTNNYYYWAKHNTGALQSTNWSVLSPDAMEQGWTAAWDVAKGVRATSLLSQLDTNQPNWYKPSLTNFNYDVTLMGWGYYLNGQTERAQQIATSIRDTAIANNRAWPFNIMTAGELIILETEGINFIFDISTVTTPPGDTEKPLVTITSPPPNSTVTNNQTIAAKATDNKGVTKMEIYIDSKLLTTSSTNSISIRWNTKRLAAGSHIITVKAYDATGNIGQSSVNVTK